MGYTTDFYGSIGVTPALNDIECDYLRRFSGSRRMKRTRGPYYAEPGQDFGQQDSSDVLDHNEPPEEQPGLWCQWVPDDDGSAISWDGGEKFYASAEWMAYIIDHFFCADARVRGFPSPDGGPYDLHMGCDPSSDFTFDHVFDGEIEAVGEDPSDRWLLVVERNVVTRRVGQIVYTDTPDLSSPQEAQMHRMLGEVAKGFGGS